MIDVFCREYGTRLLGEDFAFPTLAQLQERATDARLRELGFGYRAPYIMSAIEWVARAGGTGALAELRAKPIDECRRMLTQINGVGLKYDLWRVWKMPAANAATQGG